MIVYCIDCVFFMARSDNEHFGWCHRHAPRPQLGPTPAEDHEAMIKHSVSDCYFAAVVFAVGALLLGAVIWMI